mmetsp:Transcript_20055/g.40902  ORF Transcript_20055/g.40902 Transcript_20055/m.40902 type:complete len:155 (-) Transcript_20055:138-602(-)
MVELVHRTNYWGKYIDATNMDDEVNFDAIWVQCVYDGHRTCCPNFGARRVGVTENDLVNEHNGWWSLFRVSSTWGRSPGHYFRKFVLIPQGTHGYGKRGCAQRGWEYEGEVVASNARDQLVNLLSCYLDDQEDFTHVHIGIMMDQLYAGQGHSA